MSAIRKRKTTSLEHAPYRQRHGNLIKKVSIEFAKGIREELTKEELATILDRVIDLNEYVFRLDAFQILERDINVSTIWDNALSICGYDPTTWNSDSEEDLELFYKSIDRAFDCKFNIGALSTRK